MSEDYSHISYNHSECLDPNCKDGELETPLPDGRWQYAPCPNPVHACTCIKSTQSSLETKRADCPIHGVHATPAAEPRPFEAPYVCSCGHSLQVHVPGDRHCTSCDCKEYSHERKTDPQPEPTAESADTLEARLCDCDGFWHVAIGDTGSYYVNEDDMSEALATAKAEGRREELKDLASWNEANSGYSALSGEIDHRLKGDTPDEA